MESSNQKVIEMLQSSTAAKKTSGIGYSWRQITSAVGNAAGVVSELSIAAETFSKNAVDQALLGRVESAGELCNSMNLTPENGAEAVIMAKALREFLLSQS